MALSYIIDSNGDIHFLILSKGDLRVMQPDSSPYFTVHQVIPGGQAEETVQGEPVTQQLEKRNTRV